MGVYSSHGAQAGHLGSWSNTATTMPGHHHFVVTGQLAHQGVRSSGLGMVSQFNHPYTFGVKALASEHVFNMRSRLREQSDFIQSVRQEPEHAQPYWSVLYDKSRIQFAAHVSHAEQQCHTRACGRLRLDMERIRQDKAASDVAMLRSRAGSTVRAEYARKQACLRFKEEYSAYVIQDVAERGTWRQGCALCEQHMMALRSRLEHTGKNVLAGLGGWGSNRS